MNDIHSKSSNEPEATGVMSHLKRSGKAFKAYLSRKAFEHAERNRKREAELEARRKAEQKKLAREQAEAKAQLQTQRELRHKQLLETLSDDFSQLEHDMSETLKFIGSKMIGQYVMRFHGKLEGHSLNLNQNEREVKAVFTEGVGLCLRRTVADISEREAGVLKLLSLMNTLDLISDKYFGFCQLCIVYNDGKTKLRRKADAPTTRRSDAAIFKLVEVWLEQESETPYTAVNEGIATLGNIRQEVNDPELRAIIEKELTGAQGWLRTNSL
ncbi:cell envelope integrity protein TolA [Kordiimonas sp. SCSIO 12603]|uniref:cell envelope integrity protein TolA n=1 Tax=Kordiimonas sp. SCSIO 12603 TaxID=2829596 RepID=UPI0021079975|nr:cell envelope integrity protein TolA [Kordiimonas sp. SCSIO 12603]UTW58842.1 cell envelope integrity protein TolA [Kordiimonas sp. SCSIO 12603]